MSRARPRAAAVDQSAPVAAIPSLGALSLNDKRVFYYDDDDGGGEGGVPDLSDLPDTADLGAPDKGRWYGQDDRTFEWKKFYTALMKENKPWDKFYGGEMKADDVVWPARNADYKTWAEFQDWTRFYPKDQGLHQGKYSHANPHFLTEAWHTDPTKRLPASPADAWAPLLKAAKTRDGLTNTTKYHEQMTGLLQYATENSWRPDLEDLTTSKVPEWTNEKGETFKDKGGGDDRRMTKAAVLSAIIDSIKVETGPPGWLPFVDPLPPKQALVDSPSADAVSSGTIPPKQWQKWKQTLYFGPTYEDWLSQSQQAEAQTTQPTLFKRAKSLKEAWKTFLGLISTGSAAVNSAKARSKRNPNEVAKAQRDATQQARMAASKKQKTVGEEEAVRDEFDDALQNEFDQQDAEEDEARGAAGSSEA